MLSDTDIERRLPLWAALADLFLDTGIQAFTYAHIARTIREHGFTPDEARHILMSEVAPAFSPNLTGIAGEWAGWSEDEVRAAVTGYLRRPALLRLDGRLRAWLLRKYLRAEWSKIDVPLANDDMTAR